MPGTSVQEPSPPGRNDPCYCGSSKKYKRCHLDADRSRDRQIAELGTGMLWDNAIVAMLAATRKAGFELAVTARAEALNAQLRDDIGDGLADEHAASALAGYLERVERAMAEISGQRSRGYWIYMTRRLPPQPLGDATSWTMQLYRRVLTLAVLKYGRADGVNADFTAVDTSVGRQRIPVDLSYERMVEVFALDYLAYEYTTASQAYRRVGKGARLIATEHDFRAVADEELEGLIGDLDRRVSEYGELTGIYGGTGDRDFPTELDGHDAPIAVLTAVSNSSHVPAEIALQSKGVNVPGPPNFLLLPLVIDGYREALLPLADEVEAALGISLDVLLSVVWGLSAYLIRGIEASPLIEVQVTKTGYLTRPKGEAWDETVEELSQRVQAWFRHFDLERLDEAHSRRLAEDGLAALTYRDEQAASLSLWDRLPFKLIIDAEEFWYIDYSALPLMFADVFRQVGFLDGDAGNVKARNFESAVVLRARQEGFEPWKAGVELIHPDGTRREIDAGFVVGDVLYVVECKAYAQNPKIDRGDWVARTSREKQLSKYLAQARSLAEFIERERTGRNYAVPENVTRIEPLLCTPGVEFIRTRAPELWLTPKIPRICTREELMLVLNGELGV